MADQLTLDDALMWLNDRLGKSVAVSLVMERGDFQFSVLAAEGELRHWSEGKAAVLAPSREEIAGLYNVGDASLDLTDVHPLEVFTWPDDPSFAALTVRLDENVTLTIQEQQEEKS